MSSYFGKEPCHVEAKKGDLGTMQECKICGQQFLQKDETKKEGESN